MAETPRPARLWYQSFVHPIEQAPYMGKLQGQLDAVAAPGIKFEVCGLDPPDHLFHPLTEFRCAAQTIRNALEAERAGYDAFVIGHFQEPGLLEIRGAVDIPVTGLGEATLLAALSPSTGCCGCGYRIWPQVIDAMILVKPATVVQWHRNGFRLHWRWRSRRPGRPPRPASPSPGEFRQGRQAGADRGQVHSGNTGGDDRHDPIAREFFHEQIPQIGLYRIQRKTGNPQFLVERSFVRQARDQNEG
jgi:hypothetical protein